MNTKETNRKELSYNITAGPNRDRLFDACKYQCDDGVNIPVTFDIGILITDINILRIEHENGSGESFNLYGYCMADPNRSATKGNDTNCEAQYWFKAYYNSGTRTGRIFLNRN